MMRLFTRVLSALALTAGLTALPGCGGEPPRPEITPGPAVPNANLNGLWYSKEFGDMQLVHNGKLVTGRYEDPRGPDHNGTIRGELEGDLIRIEWIKPGNPGAAVMPQRGRGYLRVKTGGTVLEGRWGHDQDEQNGGVWNAEKSQYD